MKDGGFSQSRGPAEASFPVLISQDRDILKAVKGRSMIVKVESSAREILTERLDSRFKTPRLHDYKTPRVILFTYKSLLLLEGSQFPTPNVKFDDTL